MTLKSLLDNLEQLGSVGAISDLIHNKEGIKNISSNSCSRSTTCPLATFLSRQLKESVLVSPNAAEIYLGKNKTRVDLPPLVKDFVRFKDKQLSWRII